MLDIGWSELLLIGVVALIVVGPKDLPVMFRTLGRITAKARQMAREFSRAMEDAAKDTGLDGVAGDLKNVASKKSLGLDALERATEKFEKWDPKFPSNRAEPKAALQADPNVAQDLDAAEDAFEPEVIAEAETATAPAPAVPAAPSAISAAPAVAAAATPAPAPASVAAPAIPAPAPAAPVPAAAQAPAEAPKPDRKPRTARPKVAADTAEKPAPKPRKKSPAKKDEA
ncbi:Sec-independent protein translocase protein TatB [Paenirhodobacter populi]|uniref:Sec-independent protein translocase protein TatB n=1 Tax=Paenirhodobacter populi TaxID=2306993 RepID=UPI000FE2DB0E|nr:Sec-independent protein translocase protein TatB [Sinirhodobacter populi]RWR09330.1 twin-arginine translocase subunit TatB [Sinirhodobacter populi]